MANTKISNLGSRKISLLPDEVRKPALGNGTAKPGDIVGITDSTGKVVGTDIGASELYRGILDDLPTIPEDTAIPDGVPCMVIIPRSGRFYRVACTDPSGAVVSGLPHKLSTTAGALEGAANSNMNTAGNFGINSKALANGDTVMEMQKL
jgi:hypothetical protein